MDRQDNLQPITEPIGSVQNSKNVWIFTIVVVVAFLISGLSVYEWVSLRVDQEKKEAIEKTRNEMQVQIDSLQRELIDLKSYQKDISEQVTNKDIHFEWFSYTDPEGVYSIKVPKNWRIDSQWEKGSNLPDDNISYTNFIREEGYMVLGVSKLYSHTPEYQCVPGGIDVQIIPSLTIDGYKTYQSYTNLNLDADYSETTSYNYCVDVKGKKLHFQFVPQASDNNPSGISIFYDILETIDFK